MSLCTATLVNNAEETGRGWGKGGLEELSGDKSKGLCPADRAKMSKFPNSFFVIDLKLNVLLLWFGSICIHV